VNLQSESVRFLTQPQPYSHLFAPAAFFEPLLMRAPLWRALDGFGATMMMVFCKESAEPARTAYAA
jgi:hypothetical protein